MKLKEYKKNLTKTPITGTCIFLVKGGQVLLGHKKSGFGKGYYLGIGGKVEEGETAEEAAIREFWEEVQVKVSEQDLEHMATLNFYFPHKEDESWNQIVQAFIVRDWDGEPKETAEINPVWYEINKLPLELMWDDAKYWIPQILVGQKIKGDFLFDKSFVVVEHEKH